MKTETTTNTVKVWHLPVRMFHWSLATAFVVAYLTSGQWDTIHEWTGYTIASLVGLRILFGFFGPEVTQFKQFVHRPAVIIDYLKAMIRGTERRYIGHNPAGGAMIVVLLGSIATTCLFGWMQTTDRYWGVDWVQNVHAFMGNFVLTLVVFHLLGVILASVRHRENLARAMWTGLKREPDESDAH